MVGQAVSLSYLACAVANETVGLFCEVFELCLHDGSRQLP